MRYAITGSTGFIGQHLCRRLVDDGHVVERIRREALETHTAITHLIDWIKPDVIIHLAAYGNHYNQYDKEKTILVNVHGTINLFMASRSRGIPDYDYKKAIPLYNFTSSSMNLATQTPYSITKQVARDVSVLYPNVVNVMPYSVYGPGEGAHRFIPTVIRCLLSGEKMPLATSATHDWIYIDDFINAFMNGHTVIGSGRKYTNLEVVKQLEMLTGKKLNYEAAALRSYDNPDWVCPGGVNIEYPLEIGLIKCLQYHSK